jgi:hypothetical protein
MQRRLVFSRRFLSIDYILPIITQPQILFSNHHHHHHHHRRRRRRPLSPSGAQDINNVSPSHSVLAELFNSSPCLPNSQVIQLQEAFM